MKYLPTDEDLALLKSHSPHIYCRIDLLDKNFATVDSLEGIAIDGTVSVDSESDIRRTFNTTLYLGKKSVVSAFDEEDWISKNVRVFIGLKGRTKTTSLSYPELEKKTKESAGYKKAKAEYNALVSKITQEGHAKYGNIDNINRGVIEWNDDNMSYYSKFVKEMNGETTFGTTVGKWLSSLVFSEFKKAFEPDPEAIINKGDYSTVLGCDDKFNSLQIAYTPLFQPDDGDLIPLCNSEISRYLSRVIGTSTDPATILLKDKTGISMTLWGKSVKVHNMIAAIQGQTVNGSMLSAADVSAIAGWSEKELQEEYGTTSIYVGYSMHDVQDEVIQAKKKLNEAFNKEFEKVSVQRINVFSKNQDVHWFNQGCFSISSNGFTYNATTNTVQCSCVDLVARLNGDLAGQLTGLKTKINKGTRIAPVIKTVLTEQPMSEFSKCVIDYWTRNVPYDLEYETGTTLWQILTELRDLYYPFEMYFDDDVFVCHEIPSGFDDPPVLDPDLFASLVTADGESATVDYSTVRNCVEVFGATIDSDAYSSTATYSSEKNSLTLTVKELAVDDEANISFIMPAKITSKTLNIIVNFVTTEVKTDGSGGTEQKTTTKTSLLYKSVPNADGNDVEQEPSIMEAGKYYVIQWFPDTKHFYFIGQQQSHAMVKLVDTVPTGDKLAAEKKEENCDNLEYVCMTDPDNIDDLYNAKFSIEKIGRRNEILSGGDYDNYTTDEKAMEVAKYELWKKARLTDGLVVPILLVPWLDVNEKIQYAAKYLNSKTPVDWIIKSFSINLGEGTMSLTMSRYFPYYPYIVGHGKEESKYDIYQDWMLDQYFPDLRSDVNKNNNPTTTT